MSKEKEFINKLFDYVSKEYPIDSPLITRRVGLMITEYDRNLIQFAIDNNLSLFALDRWQSAIDFQRQYKDTAWDLTNALKECDIFLSTHLLDRILEDGFLFEKFIVSPLAEQNVNIMHLIEL